MFRKISMEAVGLSLLLLAISLVTATLAFAETRHRAFENADLVNDGRGGGFNDEPTAPMILSLTCLESTDGSLLSASVNLDVTPHGLPVHAFVSSKSFGVCESHAMPSDGMTGPYSTQTFAVGGPHCDSAQGPVSISIFQIRNYIGTSAQGAALTLGAKNYTCRVRP